MSTYQGNIIIKNPATPTGPFENGSASGIWTLNEAAEFARLGIWPTQGVSAPDPYFKNISLLLSTTALGNANNNLFVDSSSVFNPVNRSGNTTEGSFTPFSPNWSTYFNGTSTFGFSQLNLDGDFTMEAWVFFADNTTQPTLMGRNEFSPTANDQALRRVFVGGNGRHRFFDYATGFTLTGSINILPFAWTHLAVTRSGSTVRLFTNGVLDTSGTWTGSFDYNCIGGVRPSGGTTDRLVGYASSVRIVDGTAVYTSSFTPPTAPLTAIPNTKILTCQSNRFIDVSGNNIALSVNGAPVISKFAPYPPAYPGISYNQNDVPSWSAYFDGSGDYLVTPTNSALTVGTGDFTLECWINTTAPNNSPVMDSRSTDGGADGFTIKAIGATSIQIFTYANVLTASVPNYAGQWTHLAMVRASGTSTFYVNGVSYGTGYLGDLTNNDVVIGGGRYGGSASIMSSFPGSISYFHDAAATAIYTGNFTPPAAPLTAVSGTQLLTCQSAALADNSPNSLTLTPFGNTTVTGNSPFNPVGYWSNYFDGSTDWLSLDDSAAWDFGTGDFTVELWVYPRTSGTVGHAYVSTYANSGSGWMLGVDSAGLRFSWGDTYIISNSSVPVVDRWSHVAVSRSGTSVRMFLNGVQIGSTVTNSTDLTNSQGLRIGRLSDGAYAIWYYTGYMSNVRVVKGTAVYTSNFTPSATPLTAISNTSLLTCQASRSIDSSPNAFTITKNGDVSVQPFDPFYTSTTASNGGTMYFDGTGDWLTVPNSFPIQLNSSAFTVEFWANVSTSSGFRCLIGKGGASTGWAVFIDNNNYWAFSIDNLNYAGTVTPAYNAWTHVAFVRLGTSFTLYINGTAVRTHTSSSTFNQTNQLVIGAGRDLTIPYTGYISNLRISRNVAVYTSNFTPPTAPVSATPDTVLLVNGMNAGIYDATAINDIETAGNAQVSYPTPFAPANYWAAAFGSSDYAQISGPATGTGTWTVEGWFYFTSLPGGTVFAQGTADTTSCWFLYLTSSGGLNFYSNGDISSSAGGVVTANTWVHIALVSNASNATTYVNGRSVATGSYAGKVFTGGPFQLNRGYGGATTGNPCRQSNVRMVVGTAVYTANFTPPTSPLTAISGTSLLTCQNKTFIDNSTNAYTVTPFGSATAGAIGPFTATGGTSIYFDGSGDYLNLRNTADLAFGTGDFTIEMWVCIAGNSAVNPEGNRNAAMASSINASAPTGIEFNLLGNGSVTGTGLSFANWVGGTQYLISASSSISQNVWHHFAVVRSAGTTTLYVDGVSIGSGVLGNQTINPALPLRFGQQAHGSFPHDFNGYMDDIRITKGVARYTSNFTPPTRAFLTY